MCFYINEGWCHSIEKTTNPHILYIYTHLINKADAEANSSLGTTLLVQNYNSTHVKLCCFWTFCRFT